jgi:hypothetical protein
MVSREAHVLSMKMHPHIMCEVINDEQAIAKAMWGRDIDRAPNVA